MENSPQTNPIIARIECKAGHGAGRPTQKMVCVSTLLWNLISIHDMLTGAFVFCVCVSYGRLMKLLTVTALWQK